MRRVLKLSLASAIVAATMIPLAAQAQMPQQRPGQQQPAGGAQQDGDAPSRAPRIAPLRRQEAVGPCPFVKILYDAARYVEMTGDRPASSNVGFTGEIEGLSAACRYGENDPITVNTDILFNLGRGPQAQGDAKVYRYWIAVTERNRAVLAKTYFDLPVTFEGQTASVTQEQTIVIPRATTTTSGDNFEVLIGFDVTPEMAQFNRDGSRFRVNAGTVAPAAQPSAQ